MFLWGIYTIYFDFVFPLSFLGYIGLSSVRTKTELCRGATGRGSCKGAEQLP